MARIPQAFIDELLSRLDIVEVVDARVPLKKAGRDYTARCPFHEEKSPSFTVSPQKQFYHCFGCGAHGTAISFVMEYDRLDFIEAVELLAGQQGLKVPREGGSEEVRSRSPLFDLMGRAAESYRRSLKQHPAAPRAVAYLKGRGLSGEVVSLYGIGYAPPGWDHLLSTLGGSPESNALLLECGLTIEAEEGRRYDRFRDRVMFPIRDSQGRVIGFGGRVLGDEKPKYLNSPETPLFHKGRELYGLYEAKQATKVLSRLLVVEGYMDVVALAQFGIRYAVATLGTAVTPEHVEKLFRTTDELVFCFDGDRAGRDAAWRGLESALPLMREGRQLRFLFLPEGEDPDSLVRQAGAEQFEQLVQQAGSLSDYLFDQLSQQTDLATLDGRARLVELARPYLSKLPLGALRLLMEQRLAELTGLAGQALTRLLDRPAPNPGRPTLGGPARSAEQRRRGPSNPSPLRKAVALLLQEPALAQEVEVPPALAQLELPGGRVLLGIFEALAENPQLSTAALLERWRGAPEEPHLYALVEQDRLLEAGRDDLVEELRGALKWIEEQYRQKRIAELQARFRELTKEEKIEFQQLLAVKSGRPS